MFHRYEKVNSVTEQDARSAIGISKRLIIIVATMTLAAKIGWTASPVPGAKQTEPIAIIGATVHSYGCTGS